MNYNTLFNGISRFYIGKNLCCLSGQADDIESVIRGNAMPMLFVLQGEVDVEFRTGRGCIKQGHFAVIASADVIGLCINASAVVFVFYPSKRLKFYFRLASESFKLSISETLPIMPPLQQWIDMQLEQSGDNCAPTGIEEWQRCSELVRILLAYPRNAIETLFIPLFACSMGSCKNCRSST